MYHRESFAPFRFVAHNGFCVFARSSSPRTFGRTTAKYTNALSRHAANPSGSTSRSTSCGRSTASCPHSAARNFGFWLCRGRAILRSGTSSSRLCGREKPDRKAIAMTEVLREPFRVPRILMHLHHQLHSSDCTFTVALVSNSLLNATILDKTVHPDTRHKSLHAAFVLPSTAPRPLGMCAKTAVSKHC